jgi:hypothetical protein
MGAPHAQHDVDEALASIGRLQTSARLIADDDTMTRRQKCKALLEMMTRARREQLGAFNSVAIWKGCGHLFDGEPHDTSEIVRAIRTLRAAGAIGVRRAGARSPSTTSSTAGSSWRATRGGRRE